MSSPPTTAVTVLAMAMCDATNYPGSWDRLGREAKERWVHKARDVDGELAKCDWVVASLDEVAGKLEHAG